MVEVDLARLAVLARARDPCPGARLAVHPVAELGRVGQAGGHDVARRDLDAAHPDLPVRSRPSMCSTLSTLMNSSPRPYLKVTRRAFTQRGISSTSSCSTFTHSTGPMPSGKSNISGSLNGGVVYQPRSASQMTGGLRHSSIVVQIENEGAKS